MVHQLPGRFDLAGHAGDLEAGFLKVGDGHAELHPLVGVGHGVLQRPAGKPDGAGGGMGPGGVQKVHGVLETVTATAGDDVLLGDPAAVEGQLPGLPAEVADLGDGRSGAAFGQLPAGLLDDEVLQPLVLGVLRIRGFDPGEKLDVVRAVGERAPVLVAGDDPLVAFEHRPAFGRSQIGADVGLGEGDCGQVLAPCGLLRQLLALIERPAADVHERRGPGDDAGNAHPAPRQLLADQAVLEDA